MQLPKILFLSLHTKSTYDLPHDTWFIVAMCSLHFGFFYHICNLLEIMMVLTEYIGYMKLKLKLND